MSDNLNPINAINLFVWGDSLSFRRPFQPDDFGLTYPFLTQNRVEQKLSTNINILVRSRGGITIGECKELVKADLAYCKFRNDKGIKNIAVLQLGIVDCGLLPFTYRFLKISQKIPLVGGRIAIFLKKTRPLLQKISSKPRTDPDKFVRDYSKIVNMLSENGFVVLGIGLPTPNDEAELRSPGFKKSAIEYSNMIQKMNLNFIDIEKRILQLQELNSSENVRNKILVTEDGHHLTEVGHLLYAELICDKIVEISKKDN